MSKWRNIETGTVYAAVEFNGTTIAVVTTDAGSQFTVHTRKLEQVTDLANTNPEATTAPVESAPVSPSSNELDAILIELQKPSTRPTYPGQKAKRRAEAHAEVTRLLLQAHLEEVNLIDQDGGHDESFYRYAKKRRAALTKQLEGK